MMKKRIGIAVIVVLVIVLVFCICLMINSRVQTKILFEAVENNDYEAAQKAIDSGANVNSYYRPILLFPNIVGNIIDTNPTPLIIACSSGNEEIVLLLLDSGADVNKRDNITGQHPLIEAIGHGKSKVNRFDLAKILIDQGADIYATTSTDTVLMYTILISKYDTGETIQEGYELFEYLMERNVSTEIPFGVENLLTFASRYGSTETVSYLIDNSIFEINGVNKEGRTALSTAAKYGNNSIVKLLIDLGADKTITDTDGKTAYDYAVEEGDAEIAELLKP